MAETMSYEEFLSKVYSSTSTDQTQELYDQWASNYDRDLTEEGYASPSVAVQAVVKHLDRTKLTLTRLNGKLEVLDAGCGTGLVGVHLRATGVDTLDLRIDGVDLSEGMLAIAARTSAYTKLKIADLSKPLPYEEESYDVITCVGTLTKGHVKANVLKEFIRIVKRGWGLVAVTILDEIWETGGYKAVVMNEERFGRVEIMSDELFNVWKEDKQSGRMIVLRRKYRAQEIAHAGIGA